MNQKDINMLRPRRLHGWQETKEDEVKPNKRSFLFYLIPGIAVVLIFSAFSLVRSFTLSKWSDNPNDYNQLTLQPKNNSFFGSLKNLIFKSDKVMEGQLEDRINILLMGVGGANHDGGYLSDTNIILSIKPSTNEIAMISVPRDMSAKIEGYGWTKINHAHAYGEMQKSGYGGEFAKKTFEDNLNIDLPYYAVVDFEAFKEIIDIVGGIEIEVTNSFTDYSYPTYNYGYQTIVFNKGKEKMDGERALMFARSRHGNNGEGSDFARARRQQLVIATVKDKMLSAGTYLNPIKIKKIVDSLASHISTNIDFGQMMYLAQATRDIDTNNIKTLVLDNSINGFLQNMVGYDGAYLLSPKGGDFNLITNAIDNIFTSTTTPSIYTIKSTVQSDSPFPSAKIELQNGTWQVGLASRTKQTLEEAGFSIYAIGNTTNRPIVSSSIHIINPDVEDGFLQALERVMKIDATTSLPIWISNTSTTSSTIQMTNILIANTTTTSSTTDINQKFDPNTDILVILGEDYN